LEKTFSSRHSIPRLNMCSYVPIMKRDFWASPPLFNIFTHEEHERLPL